VTTTAGAAWGALVLRVVLGVILVMHAYEQVFLLGLRDLERTVVRHGFPGAVAPPVVWYSVAAEAIGGILLIVGLWTRGAAVMNLPVLFGSFFLLHLPQGFYMRGAVREAERAAAIGYELSLMVLACTIAIAMIGPGSFSIDDRRRTFGRRR
jgi:putative oxidoreductase